MYIFKKNTVILLVGMSVFAATACSNNTVSSNKTDAEEPVTRSATNSLDLPQNFIIEDGGQSIVNIEDLGPSYTGFGSDGKIYSLEKPNDMMIEPSSRLNVTDSTLILSWTKTSSMPLEVISFSKNELKQPSTDGEEYDETLMMCIDVMEEEEEEEEEGGCYWFLSPKLEGNKITTQDDIFSGIVCGKTIIKSSFKPYNSNSPVDITFYNTQDVRTLGYPNISVQSVVAQFKGDENKHPLFLKVFKVDNPNFKYFILATTNSDGKSEPDNYTIDILDRHPQYTGIIDNDGKTFLISR